MYEEFYHFKERPFSLIPDSTFLFLGGSHRRALNILEYGIQSDASITVVSGEVGTGKTTLVRNLIGRLQDNVSVGVITNTQSDFGDLLGWVLHSFKVSTEGTVDKIQLHQKFVNFLNSEYEQGHKVVLIIDEAQNLSISALEEIRMLTNINVDKSLMLQLIMVGQPELIDMLKRPELRQFAQRISADYYLQPLSYPETEEYIKHRIVTAGGDENLFAQTAYATVYYHSGGIPRVINTICDMSLVYGFADGANRIRKEIVLDAIRDRKIGGLIIKDEYRTKAAEELRKQIIEKTGVDIADINLGSS